MAAPADLPLGVASSIYEERVLALRSVLDSRKAREERGDADASYFLRLVFRWYGREFSMSPTEVERLPLADVLRHYWEAYYERLMDEHRDAELEDDARMLSEEDGDRLERQEKAVRDRFAKMDDEAWNEQVKKEEAAKREKALRKAAEAARAIAEAVKVAGDSGGGFKMVFEDPKDDEDALGGSPSRR